MWSTARITLGLSDAEFFRLTPRQYYLLVDRYQEGLQHQEWMAGTIASTVANSVGSNDGEPFHPADFMPLLDREALEKQRQEHRITKMRNLFKGMLETGQMVEVKNG